MKGLFIALTTIVAANLLAAVIAELSHGDFCNIKGVIYSGIIGFLIAVYYKAKEDKDEEDN